MTVRAMCFVAAIVAICVCGITSDMSLMNRERPAVSSSVTPPAEWQAAALPPRLALVGDSLTRGYDVASSDWPDNDTIRASLDVDRTAESVLNLGVSGQTVDEIAIRIGALPLVLQEPVTLPQTGPVQITIQEGVGWRPTRTWAFRGTLGSIPGTLTRTDDATTSMSFEADSLSEPTLVSAGSVFIGETGGPWDLMILGAGRNDVSYEVTGTHTTVVAHVQAGLKRIIDWQSSRDSRFIVWGTINTVNEGRGSSGYRTVTEINDWLQAEYPLSFVDVRRGLIDDAIYALGMTPTDEDLKHMSQDAPPPQIMADSVHWSKPVADYVSDLLHESLLERDRQSE